MPLYQQVIMALPKCSSEYLAQLMRSHTKTVFEFGGNVRGIENHGIKPLAERTRRKFAVQDGSRYFWEARFVTATFDASPQCLVEVDRMLRNEANVLRSFTMKMDTAHERVTTNMYKNPYFFEKAMPVPTK